MAEIYKQQVEHRATEGSELRNPPFRNFVKQGLDAVNEGLRDLGDYISSVEDKRLAGVMGNVVKEAAFTVKQWTDFNTDGREKLINSLMDKYDEAMASAPYDTQNRFNAVNPDARKMYELKVKEDVLEQANNQIFLEKKRTIDDLSLEVSMIRDPAANKRAFETVLNEQILNDPDKILKVTQLGALADSFAHDTAKRSILQALVDGNLDYAETFLSDPYYANNLGPDEFHSLQNSIMSLKKEKEKLDNMGGDPKELGAAFLAFRDMVQRTRGAKVSPELGVPADERVNRFFEDIANGYSVEEAYINGRQTDDYIGDKDLQTGDFISDKDLQTLKYLDSLPLSTLQLAVDEYHKTMKGVFPDFTDKQNTLGRDFVDMVSAIKIENADGSIDISKISSDQRRRLGGLVDELSFMTYGMDPALKHKLSLVKSALDRQNNRIDKTLAAKNWIYKADRSGFFHAITDPAEYIGMGNITEAMVRKAESGEKPDFLEEFLAADSGKYDTDLAYDVASTVVEPIKEYGYKELPKSNSYDYMSFVIPVIFSGISVYGNENSLQKTGLKPEVLDKNNTRLLIDATQAFYDRKKLLGEAVDTYNTYFVKETYPEEGYSTSAYEISKSAIFDMVMQVHSLAIELGLAEERAPDRSTMLSIAHALRNIAAGEHSLQSVGRVFYKALDPSTIRESSKYRQEMEADMPKTVTNLGSQ